MTAEQSYYYAGLAVFIILGVAWHTDLRALERISEDYGRLLAGTTACTTTSREALTLATQLDQALARERQMRREVAMLDAVARARGRRRDAQ